MILVSTGRRDNLTQNTSKRFKIVLQSGMIKNSYRLMRSFGRELLASISILTQKILGPIVQIPRVIRLTKIALLLGGNPRCLVNLQSVKELLDNLWLLRNVTLYRILHFIIQLPDYVNTKIGTCLPLGEKL